MTSSSVLDNDSDVDGDTLTAVLVAGPGNGSLTLNPDGTFDYTPTGTFFGTDTFHYYTTDGSLQTAIVTVTLDVQASVGTPAEDDGGTDSGNGGQAAGEASINNDGASADTDATLLDAQTTAVTDATTDGANQRDGLGAEEALPAIPTLVNNEFLTEMFLDNVPESGWQSLNVPVHKFNLQNAPLDSASNTVFRSVGSNGPALTEFFLDFLPESSGRSGAEQPAYMEFTEKLIVGSSVVVSTSFSVGYVVWMLRGGSLMTAFMSSLPAWQAFDPLPIIDSFSIDDEHADDDSLISLVRD